MYKVKNWSSYQSYKDRRPPWIRFHKTLLDDFNFQRMSANARALLPMIWLLASEHEDPISGIIDIATEEIAFRLRLKESDVQSGLDEIEKAGFIKKLQECNQSVKKSLQDSNETVPPETETETETETDIRPKGRATVYSDQFEHFWKTYPNRTGKANAYKAYLTALRTHKEITHAYLIDSARRFANAHTSAKTPSQYIPHPTTWLNQGRWEDDLSRITARSNGTQPAPNARGSQFGALMAAASELMQESGPGESMGQAGLPEWGLGSPFGLQPAAGHGQTGLPQLTDRGDTASGHTIDYDGFNPTDG